MLPTPESCPVRLTRHLTRADSGIEAEGSTRRPTPRSSSRSPKTGGPGGAALGTRVWEDLRPRGHVPATRAKEGPMSITVFLEILLGVLLVVSTIVTAAVLWPGKPRHH
ncbi:hypothetical protein Pta02_38000 [Planobispora takensis]|uniref:Uncharacterized protein n=1 Tax=Planobispora takensis TaxID=1367882 RepID=A0A8J3WWD7_9ACTN|nr:hypothetical protein Pta02_38000 [Planobispora takensis]